MRYQYPYARALAVLASLAVMFGGLAFVSAFAFWVAPASAASVHQFVRVFSGAGEAPEALQRPVGLAVDNSPAATNGDVYVGDTNENVVDRFSAAGKYLGQLTGAKTLAGSFATPWGLAVDQSDGAVYVADEGPSVVDKFKSSAGEELPEKSFGEEGQISAASIPAGQLGSLGTGEPFTPHGVAVDPATGDLYVDDVFNFAIDVFDPSGRYLRQFTIFPSTYLTGSMAIDSAGNLFITSGEGDETVVYSAATGIRNLAYGGGTGVIDAHQSNAVGVDPANDDVYVSSQSLGVVQYSKTGSLISSWGPEHLSVAYESPPGIGVGDSAGEVYVANSGSGSVAVFTRSLVLVPDVSTGGATPVRDTTATLHGTVSADGGPSATCAFQYVANSVFETSGFEGAPTAACFPAGPFFGSSEEAISAGLSGLSPETEYHYRLVGSDENGPNPGATATFQTLPAVNLRTQEASSLTAGDATLNGTVTPEGQSLKACVFEYGETEAYGQTIACEEPNAVQVGNGDEPVKVHASITGLTAKTAYHFRLTATNADGTSHGTDQLLGEPPRVDATSAAGVTSSSAELQAQIDPGGVSGTYHFEYLSEEQYKQDGQSFASGPALPTKIPIPDAAIASSRSDVAVAEPIVGLAPESTYYYRVVAGNSAAPGGVDGPVKVFVTHPASFPTGLPDDRVYELVSPSIKTTGGSVYGIVSTEGRVEGTEGAGAGVARPVEAVEGGSEVVYGGADFFGATKHLESGDSLYASVRGPGGWSTRNVSGDSPEEAFAPLSRPSVPSVPVLPGSVVAPGATVLEGTPDGSEIFFIDEERLTGDSTAAPGEPDLYRYDAPSKQLSDLTVDNNAGEHADVQGILGVGGPAGEEGSYVYLVATGDLTGSEANGQSVRAQVGQPNLYLSHGGAVVFIATLSSEDNEYQQITEKPYLSVRDWESNPGDRTAEVSQDGRYVAFGAREDLTGQPGQPDSDYEHPELNTHYKLDGSEVFRYDADTRLLACASCNPDGSMSPPAVVLYSGEGNPRQHYMANNGRVYFDDTGPLTPQDVNGRVDVYEFEDAGMGTCETSGGCRFLISGGGGSDDSFLAAVGGEGSDVFFTTYQQLTSEDHDDVQDLYDARVDGRRPSEPSVCETGEACHEPVPQPLTGQVGGSVLFSGPGNQAPPGPAVEPKPKPKPKARALTRAQKLARALKVCQRKPKDRRASCRRGARTRYGVKANVKRSSGRSKS